MISIWRTRRDKNWDWLWVAFGEIPDADVYVKLVRSKRPQQGSLL